MNNLIQIENKVGKVKLDGEIHTTAMDALIDKMATLYGDEAVKNHLVIGEVAAVANDSLTDLEIEINSPGGSVKQGYRAYKTIMELRNRGVNVTANITKLAASMGSIIAAAANSVTMESKAKMMIHDASSFAWGNAEDMQKTVDLLNGVSDELAAIYSERTGKPLTAMRDLMRKETWMTAEQAVEAGFADSIYEADPKSDKPSTRLDRLLNGDTKAEFDIRPTDGKPAGMNLIDRLKSPSNEESLERIAALENQISLHDTEIEDYKSKVELAEAALQEAAGYKAEIENLTAGITAKEAEIAALTTTITDNTATIENLAGEVSEAKESAGKIAAETLASIGQPEPLPEIESAPTGSLLVQYNEMKPGHEKSAFLALHAEELRRLAKAENNI